MGKKDNDKEFNPAEIPEDDMSALFNEGYEADEQEPDDDDSDNSKVDDEDEDDDPQSDDENQDDDEDKQDEEEDDFSDLGLDDEEAGGKKPKTSKKVPEKFKGKNMEDIVTAYENAEKEIGRLRNEITDMKKTPPKADDKDKGKGGQDDNVERIDLAKVFNVNSLNELILTSDKPGEVILDVIAKSFNALQEGAVNAVKKTIEDQHQMYQDKYFSEIDQSRAERDAAKPFVEKAKELSRKYKNDWDAILPYMQRSIEKNPDLISKPDDYETLYTRCKAYLKSKGKLDELQEQNHRAKKAGGFSANSRHRGGNLSQDDEQAILGELLGS